MGSVTIDKCWHHASFPSEFSVLSNHCSFILMLQVTRNLESVNKGCISVSFAFKYWFRSYEGKNEM